MIAKLKAIFLHNTSPRQTVFKNTSWLFLGELVGRVIRFSIVIYAARVLGAADYGVFSYALTLAAFLTIFSDLGISPVLTKETAKDPSVRQAYFSSAFILKLILIVINAGILLFLIPLFSRVEAAHALFPLVVAIFAFDSLREFGFGMNRALELMEREAFVKILLNATVAGLGFWFLAAAATPLSLMWAYVIGTGAGLLATAYMLRDYVVRLFTQIHWQKIWPLFTTALPIGILGVLGAIAINTDMIMLGWWRNPEEIGYYAAAQKIILLLYIIPGLFAGAAFPVFSRLANVNNVRFREVFQKVVAASTLLALPIFVGGWLLTRQIIVLLFGPEYISATNTLEILFLTILITFPCAIIPNALFAYDKQRYFLLFAAVGAGGNVLLNILLIPRYGIEGSAVATVITQLLGNALVWYYMQRTNHFSFWPHIRRGLLATLGMGVFTLVLAMLGIPVLLNIALSAAVYLYLLHKLREPLLHEIRTLLQS
ncbi:MAG: hypothetical protein COU11_00595 [Candidatus Harrisonbacteria bacterium CG10_big_fil_rev_8_21_14_0_10_49_15]|uniref:Uncharacterized protein n=1 Tax=Candidatus Harrisonbacteria bacterium CG10_big_fil_rev_8_21_14_0_10_49_15 TaxID=1974587 RepID=A0A2H0ULX2_9BACT|nr:MAG: hypothetical protein COU11_00595 [Candidatus Harrisonbacteria bacterium CG10_big_fil_rev_8_21_14_0_10_49_15]